MTYEAPKLEILTLSDEDIIATSETSIFEIEDDEALL